MEPHRSRQISFRGSDGKSIFTNSNTHHVDIVLQICSQPFNTRLSISQREQSLTSPIRGGGGSTRTGSSGEKGLRTSITLCPATGSRNSLSHQALSAQPAVLTNWVLCCSFCCFKMGVVQRGYLTWSLVWFPICNSTSASWGLGLQAHDTRPNHQVFRSAMPGSYGDSEMDLKASQA